MVFVGFWWLLLFPGCNASSMRRAKWIKQCDRNNWLEQAYFSGTANSTASFSDGNDCWLVFSLQTTASRYKQLWKNWAMPRQSSTEWVNSTAEEFFWLVYSLYTAHTADGCGLEAIGWWDTTVSLMLSDVGYHKLPSQFYRAGLCSNLVTSWRPGHFLLKVRTSV